MQASYISCCSSLKSKSLSSSAAAAVVAVDIADVISVNVIESSFSCWDRDVSFWDNLCSLDVVGSVIWNTGDGETEEDGRELNFCVFDWFKAANLICGFVLISLFDKFEFNSKLSFALRFEGVDRSEECTEKLLM